MQGARGKVLSILFSSLGLLAATRPPQARAESLPDFQTWSQVELEAPLDAWAAGLDVSLESTVRRGSPESVDTHGSLVEHPRTALFVRPSVGYAFTSWLSARLGYAWAPVYVDGSPPAQDTHEQRAWEQLGARYAGEHWRLASRSRFEQRFRSQGHGTGECEWRLRERLKLAYALPNQPELSVVASDEFLFYLNRTTFPSAPGFAESRALFGLAYHAGQATITLGYLNQWVPAHHGPSHVSHVLATSLRFSLSHRR